MDQHSAEFVRLRDQLVHECDDVDRRRLAALFGCMTQPQPPLSPAAVALLRTFVDLPVGDRARVFSWFRCWVSQFGQMPRAAAVMYRGVRKDGRSEEPAK